MKIMTNEQEEIVLEKGSNTVVVHNGVTATITPGITGVRPTISTPLMQQAAHLSNHGPTQLETVEKLRVFVRAVKAEGKRVALVPTMGALHEGHFELVREGLKQADICIVSIFVNPTQFGPNEDFDAYPRQLAEDVEKLEKAGAQAVFTPSVHEMYPDGFATTIAVTGVSELLEGTHRPGHFDGVATVVTKLLLQTLPDVALFGEKDYQQLQVIKRAVSDLNIPVNVIGVPTVRDENGLVLSSRNAYLNEEQYDIAIKLNKMLFAMADDIANGKPIDKVQYWGLGELTKAGFDKIDYLEIRDAKTLLPVAEKAGRPLLILVAAFLGRARLIDNVPA